MNTKLRILHIMKNGNYIDEGFTVDLVSFKKSNKNLDWDAILSSLLNGEHYQTVNQPYNNIEIRLD